MKPYERCAQAFAAAMLLLLLPMSMPIALWHLHSSVFCRAVAVAVADLVVQVLRSGVYKQAFASERFFRTVPVAAADFVIRRLRR